MPLLALTAELQRDAIAVLDALAVDIDPTDVRALREQPVGLARHVLRTWWRRETASSYAPPSSAIDRMLAVALGGAASADVIDGWRIARRAGRLRLVPPGDRPLAASG